MSADAPEPAEGPRSVVVAAPQGAPTVAVLPILSGAGFSTARVSTLPELDALAGPPDLLVVDEAFGPEGGIAVARALREREAWRRVSLLVVLPAGAPHLEECLVAGINDFVVAPFPAEEILHKARRLTEVAARKVVQSIVRVREIREGSTAVVGRTLNVSVNGILIETEGALHLGRIVELEFFLPEDPASVRSRGQVARRANEGNAYHPAYGIRFLELSARDRERIGRYVSSREAAGREGA